MIFRFDFIKYNEKFLNIEESILFVFQVREAVSV